MIKIAPSILSADFSKLGYEVMRLDSAGADYIHIDIMDGHFVPNITMGPMIVKSLRDKTSLPFDVHLMMDNPMEFIDAYIDAGADSITIHAEVLSHLHRAIHYIKDKGIGVAVALNPSTSLEVLNYVLQDIDMVLIMTVNPGFGGQKFIPGMIQKIVKLSEKIDHMGLNVDIQVDGGISTENIDCIAKAGANIFVAGSAIFSSEDMAETIKLLKDRANI